MANYSIWVLEFARAPDSLAAFLIHGQPGARELPFCLTVLQSDDVTILVDTGFSTEGSSKGLADMDGVTMWSPPIEVLSRIGVRPDDVTTIILTHAHYDHLGGVADYPQSAVLLQRRELSKWEWAMSLPAEMGWLKGGVNTDDLASVSRLSDSGQLRLVDGAVTGVLPGISLEPDFDTHTYGHQHVVVDNDEDGRWILPGDAVYTYANVEGIDGDGVYVPIGFATGSQENSVMAIDGMVKAVGGETRRIIPGHEYLLWERYPSKTFADGFHVAEITLRPGDGSRL